MNLHEASELLVDIVAELKQTSTHPKGVLGARVHAEMKSRGHGDLHRELGMEKFGHLLQRCQPPLVISKEPPLLDLLVDIADQQSKPNVSGEPEGSGSRSLGERWLSFLGTRSESTVPSVAQTTPDEKSEEPSSVVTTPSPQTHIKTATTQSKNIPPPRVDSRLWRAVLFTGQDKTFIGEDGSVTVGTPPPRTHSRIERMSSAEQVRALDDIKAVLKTTIANKGIHDAILAVLETAKTKDSPILAFSQTTSPLYRFVRDWNSKRIASVRNYIARTTGVTPPDVSPTTPIASRDISSASTKTTRRPIVDRATSHQPDMLDEVRRDVKHAIDRMDLSQLLSLRLPVGAMIPRDR